MKIKFQFAVLILGIVLIPIFSTVFFLMDRLILNTYLNESPTRFAFQVLVILLIVLVLFTAVVSIIIARSITQSITLLEKATTRIASGELDIVLPSRRRGSTNEITSLTHSLDTMRLSLKEEADRRYRFIMGVTHDLKTPLALIKGYAEAIADNIDGDAEFIKHSTDIINNKTDQLEGMIDELIGFVRLNSDEWRDKLEEVNLYAFLMTFAKAAKNDAELLSRDFYYEINIGPNTMSLLNENLFHRALENLVSNAIRYTGKDGHIILSANEIQNGENKKIIILVKDDGPGISEEDLPHIFEIFVKGRPASQV
jgi:signal transduction histidine kinase